LEKAQGGYAAICDFIHGTLRKNIHDRDGVLRGKSQGGRKQETKGMKWEVKRTFHTE